MVLKYRDWEISSLEDTQNLTAKELKEILRCHSESTAGIKVDLVRKVYALLMRDELPSRGMMKILFKIRVILSSTLP